MPLEACMLVIDNSEYMRNGDYAPTRFAAQTDAVTTVFSHKVDSNPENTAGVMSMAGKSPEVLVTPTQDIGKILSALHATKLSGTIDLITSIQVAQLALKHRQNKNLRQRVIVFVGSPVDESIDEKTLTRLAKKLKKNNIALDVVLFGEFEGNEARMKALIDGVNNNENSHLVVIPPSSNLLSDVLLISPILREPGESGAPGGAGPSTSGGGDGGFDFGFDPSLDPELAMALRMSVEEEQARQRAAASSSSNAEATASSSSSSGQPVSSSASTAQPLTAVPNTDDVSTPKAEKQPLLSQDNMDEDAELAAAIALSTSAGGKDAKEGSKDAMDEDEEDEGKDKDKEEELTEEEEIAKAIAMSMKDEKMEDAQAGKEGEKQ